MAKITKEELRNLARMSQVAVHEHEIDGLIAQIDGVLSYAERVTQIAKQADEDLHKAENVWRADEIIPTNAETILAQAPEQEAHYFVVPKILDNN